MFNKEKFLIAICVVVIGGAIGAMIGYVRGQTSRQAQIDSLQRQLLLCNATTNNLDIGKVKGKGAVDIIQKIQKETYTPYVFGCRQDTAGIIKYFCDLSRKERRKIEKNLD